MSNSFLFAILLLSTACVHKCFGTLPPKYLGIEGHEKCFHSQSSGTSIQLCLPAAKRSQCSDEAWRALNGLEDGQHPPACGARSAGHKQNSGEGKSHEGNSHEGKSHEGKSHEGKSSEGSD